MMLKTGGILDKGAGQGQGTMMNIIFKNFTNSSVFRVGSKLSGRKLL